MKYFITKQILDTFIKKSKIEIIKMWMKTTLKIYKIYSNINEIIEKIQHIF